jgi:hypothetical protein
MTVARVVDGETYADSTYMNTLVDGINGLPGSALGNARASIFNVLDYGAVGDGVTDDRESIQDAYIAAYEAGGGTVLWPDGEYYLEPRAGFGFSSFQIFLWVFGSNITTKFAPGASAKIREGHVNGYVIFAGAMGQTPDTIDDLGTEDWVDLFYPEGTGYAVAFTAYDIDPADAGDSTITLDTAADHSNFAVGDAIFIRSGQTLAAPNNGQPDSELNEITAINTGTGVLTLKWPLAKDYVQEYYLSGTTGLTSTSVTANPALLSVQNVESIISRNIRYEGATFDVVQTDGRGFGILHSSVLDYAIIGSRGSMQECSLQSGGPYRQFALKENFVSQSHTTGTESFWTSDRGCGDEDIFDNTFIATGSSVGNFHIHEGSFNVRVARNRVINKAGANSGNHVMQVMARGYDIFIEDNYIYYDNAGVGQAVFIADTVTGGRVKNNHCAGTRGVTVAGEGFEVAGNTGLVTLTANGGNITEVRTLSAWIYFDSDEETIIGQIPPATLVVGRHIYVETAFDGASPRIAIGAPPFDGLRYAPLTLVDAQGITAITPSADVGYYQNGTVARDVLVTYLAGGSAAGRALVSVSFAYVPQGIGA